jgi:preprotein translocase subunit SecF
MRWFKNANYNIVGVRRKVLAVSITFIIIGLVSAAVRGGYNFGIDFTGGMLVEVGFGSVVPIHEVRGIVERAGFKGAEITTIGGPTDVMIKVKHIGEAADAARRIETALKEQLPQQTVDVRRVESVGPKIGSELRKAAIWAIIYSWAGIIAYVAWRFNFRMGVAGVVALIHDVLFTVGFLSITNREISISVIAALLTLIGYSINDTIVVFDRIRENLQTRRREGFANVVNTSINQTLSRTIITSLTVLLSLIVLIIFAGPVIRDFALTLFVGIIVGTYSSIFVASPIIVEWDLWSTRHRKPAK